MSKDLNRELTGIEKQIHDLQKRKRDIKRQLKEIEQFKNPKISISKIKDKYLIGKTRFRNKVLSVYVGKLDQFVGRFDVLSENIAKERLLKKMKENLSPDQILTLENQQKKPKRKTIRDHIRAITEESYDPNYFKNLTEEDIKTFIPYFILKYM